ncbi:pilus assembly protein PilP, partial [Aeromonas sanarellii]
RNGFAHDVMVPSWRDQARGNSGSRDDRLTFSCQCHLGEQLPLASLSMKGSIGRQGQLWALINTPDGQAVRVGLNQHMGLDQGRVIKITKTHVDLMETVPDGKGCWVTRETQLAMANLDAKL